MLLVGTLLIVCYIGFFLHSVCLSLIMFRHMQNIYFCFFFDVYSVSLPSVHIIPKLISPSPSHYSALRRLLGICKTLFLEGLVCVLKQHKGEHYLPTGKLKYVCSASSESRISSFRFLFLVDTCIVLFLFPN